MAREEGLLSIEVFAAKGWEDGHTPDMFLAVSRDCGLKQAEALRVDGLTMVALQNRSILPIEFPPLTEAVRQKLIVWARTGKPLAVGEFMARGLVDAYFLSVVVAR